MSGTTTILTNKEFDNAMNTLTNQHASLRMRLDSKGNLGDPQSFYEVHDNQTYNQDNISQAQLNSSSALFNTTAVSREQNALTNNFINEHKRAGEERYDNVSQEKERIKTNLEKTRIQVMNANNNKMIYKYHVRIVLVSFFFFSIIGFLLLSISAYLVEEKQKEYHMWVYIAATIVTILYLLIIYLYYRETWRRHNDDFGKLKFKPPSV